MQWEKEKIIIDSGEEVDAQAPAIISASHSTDIPAFYYGVSFWQNIFHKMP
jgi:hypothetical protein